MREPVKRAITRHQLSPVSRAQNRYRFSLGLAPQALCSRLLRRL